MARATRYSQNTMGEEFAKKMCIYLLYGTLAFVASIFITNYIDVLAYRKVILIIVSCITVISVLAGTIIYILYIKKKKSILKEIACNLFVVVLVLIIPLCFGADGGKIIEIIIPTCTIGFLAFNILRNESLHICILTGFSLVLLKLIEIKTNIFYVNPLVSEIIIYVGIFLMLLSAVVTFFCKKNDGKLFKIQLFPKGSGYILFFVGLVLTTILIILAFFFREFIIKYGMYFVLVYFAVSMLYYFLNKMNV